jgi:flagellin-like hook-associated protein FlgL
VAIQIKLSSAIRANLLSLQQTAQLVARTQERLSTGLNVAFPVADAVAFFQAKSLSDRAGDLTAKKNGIDQGISALTTALQAVESAEDIFAQMKGLALSAKSGSAADRATLVIQFNELAVQADNLVNDSSYQGLNLERFPINLVYILS